MSPLQSPNPPHVAKLEALIAPLLSSLGLELYELEVNLHSKDGLVRVLVDRPGGFTRGEGVSVREIVEVTREISSMLDVEDPIEGRYRLEVFSPGLERSLTRPRHYDGLSGAEIHVVLSIPQNGQSVIDGVLKGREDDVVLVEDQHGESHRIPMAVIKRANTIHDWGRR